MSRIITWILAVLVLPLGFSVPAALAARRLFSWPPVGARFGGVAAALLFVGVDYALSRRFLQAPDRERQPREVGAFLVRLASLHGLALLAAAGGYLLVWAGGEP